MDARKIETLTMASLQVLKCNPSSVPAPRPPSFPGKSSWFFSESSYYRTRILRLRSSSFPSQFHERKRFTVFCAARDSGEDTNGEEPPESLFMKELKRRGMTPTSLLEDTNASDYGFGDETRKEGRAFGGRKNAVSTEVEKSLSNQRERSMRLNSEGLEGLIPRAKLLLTIGGTFFLGFWPLILITIAFFAALYFYFGPAFIHDASKTPISPPQYIDPYALLEEERISQIAPRVN